MTLRCVLAVLALAGATFAGPEVTELKVDVESVPEGCTTKSKHGDMLTMHYVGTLDDGTKFDSRYVRVLTTARRRRRPAPVTLSSLPVLYFNTQDLFRK